MFHRPRTEAQTPEQTPGTTQLAEVQVYAVAQSEKTAQPSSAVKPSPYQSLSNSKSSNFEEKSMNTNTQDQDSQNRSVDIPATASPFQRPGQPSAQPARGMPSAPYGTSYGAGSYNTAGVNPTARPATQEGRKLVIGQGITMSGEIEACDVLVVEGTVEAALKGASILEVSESGTFYGTVEIDECMIAGRFEGDLTVNGRLTIRASGSITGSISYKELAAEAGATIDGKISPLSAKGAAKSEKSAKAKKRDQQESTNGSELPFSSDAAA